MAMHQRRRQFLRAAGAMATAAIAGCSGGDGAETSSPTSEPTLSVAEFVFCDSQPEGYDDYTAREGATYAVDETVWVYLDVVNIGSESAGEDRVAVDLTESLSVTGPDGETILEDTIAFDNEFAADLDLQTFFIVNDIHLPTDAAGGEYAVEVSIDDAITAESTTVTRRFTAEN